MTLVFCAKFRFINCFDRNKFQWAQSIFLNCFSLRSSCSIWICVVCVVPTDLLFRLIEMFCSGQISWFDWSQIAHGYLRISFICACVRMSTSPKLSKLRIRCVKFPYEARFVDRLRAIRFCISGCFCLIIVLLWCSFFKIWLHEEHGTESVGLLQAGHRAGLQMVPCFFLKCLLCLRNYLWDCFAGEDFARNRHSFQS